MRHSPASDILLREALRGLAATVCVVTIADGAGRDGMTATAVMPLALDPPGVAIAINRSAGIHDRLRVAGGFCVNMLACGQDDVGRRFAERPAGEARFAAGSWLALDDPAPGLAGLPFLAGAQASLFCTLAGETAWGTHSLFLGHVHHVGHGAEPAPLVYCDRRFGAFAAAS